MITYWYSSNIQYTILHENKKKKYNIYIYNTTIIYL